MPIFIYPTSPPPSPLVLCPMQRATVTGEVLLHGSKISRSFEGQGVLTTMVRFSCLWCMLQIPTSAGESSILAFSWSPPGHCLVAHLDRIPGGQRPEKRVVYLNIWC